MAGMFASGMFGAPGGGGGYAAGYAAGQADGLAAGLAVIAGGVDLSADQYFLHGLATVELDGVDVLNVYRHTELEVENDLSEGVYVSRRVQFDFPVGAALYPAGRRPYVGSAVIDDDGVAYVIETVQHPFDNDYWGCVCRSAVIAGTFGLDDEVTLYPAIITDDVYGSKIIKHTLFDASFERVAAKIMLRKSRSEQYEGQDQFLENYDVYVDEDIGQVNNGDILKDQDGKEYQIVSYRTRLSFNEFSVIECQLRQLGP